MHKDDIDLARRLFATALAKLEDATYIACRGQPTDITPALIRREAEALGLITHDVVAIAEAILALTHHVDTKEAGRRKKSR